LSEVTIPELPGLYGNQYQLQVDVSRLPRVEEYQQILGPDSITSVTDIPSDVKTVTYYVKTAAVGAPVSGVINTNTSLASLTNSDPNATGLIRRQLDRAVTSSAIAQGNTTGLTNAGDLLAPEVVGVEFRYFDGTQWLLQWDTTQEESLPLAVQILLAISSTGKMTGTVGTTGLPGNVHIYSMIVHLPTGGQPSSSASSGSSTSSTSGSSTSSASGSTSSTGGTQ